MVSLPEEEPFFVSIFRAVHSCRLHYVPLDVLPMHTFGGLSETCWLADVEDLLRHQLVNGWVDMNGNDSLNVWNATWQIPDVYQPLRGLVQNEGAIFAVKSDSRVQYCARIRG